MTKMAEAMKTKCSEDDVVVTVADVTKNNFTLLWPSISYAVKSATFIAIDLELSGLGDRKLLTTSEDEYIVEPQSLQFLVNHGFDFNKQYADGIPFKKGNLKKIEFKVSIRQLLFDIISAKKPLVFHNGFIDLVFFYQSFYAELPNSLQTFVADTFEMFPNGIYDTKYMSEFHARERLSFLEYLFRKCQYNNQHAQNDGKNFIKITSTSFGTDQSHTNEEIVECTLPTVELSETFKTYVPFLCESFRTRGYCSRGTSCPKMHNVELILASEDESQGKKRRRRTRKRKRPTGEQNQENIQEKSEGKKTMEKSENGERTNVITKKKKQTDEEDVGVESHSKEGHGRDSFTREDNSSFTSCDQLDLGEHKIDSKVFFEKSVLPRMNGHRAGFDAFMTGYCFSFYQQNLSEDATEESKNKIYLTAKDMPLILLKSHFAKTSVQCQNIAQLLSQQNV